MQYPSMTKKKIQENPKVSVRKNTDELRNRYEKVANILENIDEVDADDIMSFCIVLFGMLRSHNYDYYEKVFDFVDGLKVTFDGEEI